MPDPTTIFSSATRLRNLLECDGASVIDEAVTDARTLGPDAAGGIVVSIIEAELTHPAASPGAIRAAHLAHELRLARALPSLVQCLEVLPDVHPLRLASAAAVTRYGADAVEPLLAAFERCNSPEGRARIAEALSRTAVGDDRIRAAFVRMLEDDPGNGARLLAEYGDWRAVAELGRTVDRLLATPLGDCAVCRGEHLIGIARAVRALGGRLSDDQYEGIDRVLELREAPWIPFEDPLELPRSASPTRASPRLGRNDPCHCGSGKKYKRCHLDADERDARH